MPRHPPCALCSLPNKHSTTNTKTHHYNYTRPTPHTPTHKQRRGHHSAGLMLASTIQKSNTKRTPPRKRPHQGNDRTRAPQDPEGSDVSEPQQCAEHPPHHQPPSGSTPPPHTRAGPGAVLTRRPATRAGPTSTIPPTNTPHRCAPPSLDARW